MDTEKSIADIVMVIGKSMERQYIYSLVRSSKLVIPLEIAPQRSTQYWERRSEMTRIICLERDCLHNDEEVCTRAVITIQRPASSGFSGCVDYQETTPGEEE